MPVAARCVMPAIACCFACRCIPAASCLPLLAALQELWLSVGEQLPEEDEEMAAELRKIGASCSTAQVAAYPSA